MTSFFIIERLPLPIPYSVLHIACVTYRIPGIVYRV